MKLYMVDGYENIETIANFYGVFSTEEKANEIKRKLEESMKNAPLETETYEVSEVELDEPTELYDFMINNWI